MFLAALMLGSAVASGYGQYQQYKSQSAMAKYNAKVAENDAIAAQYAIESERAQLTKGQREAKAKGRMSVASRGGVVGGTDLLSLAEEAKEMQLDQLELSRHKDIASIRGASEAAMSRYQGKVAKSAGRWTVGTTLLGGAAQSGMMIGASGGNQKPTAPSRASVGGQMGRMAGY